VGGVTKDLIAGLLAGVLDALTAATLAALNWVLGLLSATMFASPDVTALPQVAGVAGRAQLVANACMVLVVMVVGVLAMTHGTVQERYSLKELLPRMVIGFCAANLATPIVRAALTGANAVTEAMVGDRLAGQDPLTQIRRITLDVTTDPAMFLLALVLRELVMWMLVLLVITWLGRLSVLLVVAGTGPVALVCHALPQTEVVARLWWRSLAGCLAVQVLQAVTLHLAVATLLSDTSLPALGLPHDPTGLLNLLIACFLLWLVIRIPRWVARTLGTGGGRGVGILSSLARVVVVQHLLGAVGLRGGRRLRGPHPAGTRIRPPADGGQPPTGARHVHQHLHVHPPRPGGAEPAGYPPRPGRYHAGAASTGRAHPGRPPRALEDSPPPRRPLGPGRPRSEGP
jgi:hypothetical protein